MNLSTEMGNSGNGTIHAVGASRTDRRPLGDGPAVERDVSDLVQAESRIEALRSLVLVFLREVESLKKAVGPKPRTSGDAIDLDKEMDEFEGSLIRDALVRCKGNQRDAAKLLNVKPTTLHAKMKRLGISIETTVTGVE